MRIEAVIGANIREARERRGLKQSELAALMNELRRGWTHKTVSLAEKGRRSLPAADVLAFAACLGTTVAALYTPSVGVEPEVSEGQSVGREPIVGYAATDMPGAGQDRLVARLLETAGVMVSVATQQRAQARQAEVAMREEFELLRDLVAQLRDTSTDQVTPMVEFKQLADQLRAREGFRDD